MQSGQAAIGNNEDGELLLLVSKPVMESVQAAMEKNEDVAAETFMHLYDMDDDVVADDAVMVYCDMGRDVADLSENMIETLGPNRVAEIFVTARKKFLDAWPDEEVSGAKYKKMNEDGRYLLQVKEEEEEGCGEGEEDGEDEGYFVAAEDVEEEKEEEDEPVGAGGGGGGAGGGEGRGGVHRLLMAARMMQAPRPAPPPLPPPPPPPLPPPPPPPPLLMQYELSEEDRLLQERAQLWLTEYNRRG
jgi:hypothetical protein